MHEGSCGERKPTLAGGTETLLARACEQPTCHAVAPCAVEGRMHSQAPSTAQPGNAHLFALLHRLLQNRGFSYRKMERYEDAVADYTTAVKVRTIMTSKACVECLLVLRSWS